MPKLGAVWLKAATKGPDVRQQLPQADYLRQVIERLERVSRIMNPLLLFVAVSLVVLNLACVVNLIDWRDLPRTPEASAAAAPAATGPCKVAPANASIAQLSPATVTHRN